MVISAKERSVVFEGFPLDSELYVKEVQAIQNDTIRRYGFSEWRAAVLTNELHGHLGIYSLVGVKMGCLALEYFPTGDDPLSITSYAGMIPPLSCLNDGLQVATGATLGRGAIHLSDHCPHTPEALFQKGERRVRIRLKEECAQQIATDTARGRARYSTRTAAYWEYIRQLAIGYWLTFDRHLIFEVESINSEKS